MNAFKYILAIGLATGGLTSNAFSQSVIDDRFDQDLDSRNQVSTFEATGVLRCEDNAHRAGKACKLQFVRITDKEVLDVEANSDLVKIHCDDHRDAKIHVSGMYAMKTVIGNDRIKIDSFDTIKKLESNEVERLLRDRMVKQQFHHVSFSPKDI